MATFSGDSLRSHFPALQKKNVNDIPVYFDGPGGTQMAQKAIDRMVDYIKTGMANLHGTFPSSQRTDILLEDAKAAVADLLNCEPQEVAFGQNMTSLAFHVARSLRHYLQPGDEIVVTEQDHRANVDPWITLEKETGAKVKFIPLDKKSFTLDLEQLDSIITPKTKIVAAGLSSNLTGTITDIESILRRAKEVEAFSIVDAVHAVPHFPVDFKKLDCDILFCSAYKFFGPHLGIAVIKTALFEEMPIYKLKPAPEEIPYKLETGTQNHEGIAGLMGAIEFIEELGEGNSRRQRLVSGMQAIEKHEEELISETETFLNSTPEVELYRAAPDVLRAPTFAFRLQGIHSREAAKFLAENHNIYVGDGHFYASTMAELFDVNDTGGWVRIGFAPYNTIDEINRFKTALKDCIASLS